MKGSRFFGFLILGGFLIWSQHVSGTEVLMDQVVVTATKTEVAISESPQAISVLTREEIIKNPQLTLGEIIQRATGMEVSQYGPRGALSLPKIRGAESGQVLVLINGRRISDAQSGQFDLSSLPILKEDIERIEVLRGAASALYGADAMGGVINIITKKPAPEAYTRAAAAYGRFDTQAYTLTHRWQPGAFGYGISLAKEKSNGYRPNSDLDAFILSGQLNYEFNPQQQVNFAARFTSKEIGVPGSEIYPDLDDRQKDEITQLDLTYRGKFQPLELNLKGFQNIYRRTFEPGSQGMNIGTPFLHKNYATGGEVQINFSPLKSHFLAGGVEVIQDRVDSTHIGVHEANRAAFYLQDEIGIAPPLSLTVGLRFDAHSIYEDQFNPRVGMLIRLPGEARLRASVGRSFRAPTFDDLYWPEDAFVAGNPNLKPEKAWSYEIGGEKRFGKLAFFRATGFRRDVDDLIYWSLGEDWKFRPNNVRSAKIWGGELELIFYPLPGLSIPVNYSYIYPRDEETGEPISAKPKQILNIGLEYTTSIGLKISLHGRYGEYWLNQTSKLNRDYFILDAQIRYEFKIYKQFKGEVFLALNNALNRQYQIVEGYPMPPQAFSGGISFAF
ncbi:MAG: TonB-dependent receptor plug domain-containing protein [Thermodesulfobacteriota bacterium]